MQVEETAPAAVTPVVTPDAPTEEVAKEEIAVEKPKVVGSPKETLYVNNLNEKSKIEEIKKALYTLFAQYGTVLEIIASKSYSLRGQAWIVFSSTTEASTAMQKLNETIFYEKPLRIQYALTKSDVIQDRDGVHVDKESRKQLKRKQREEEAEERAKKRRALGRNMANNDPNKLLLVQNIPTLDPQILHDMLNTLFGQFEGLQEIRMAPGRGVAFVEFENEIQSARAREGLQNFKIAPEFPLSVSFAK